MTERRNIILGKFCKFLLRKLSLIIIAFLFLLARPSQDVFLLPHIP